MKYLNLIFILLMLFFLWGCAEVPQNRSHHAAATNHNKLARVTVYWAKGKGSDRWTRQHKSATGVRLHDGNCAVDPRKIEYGSQIVYPDGSVDQAVDTGTDVVNRKAARLAGRTIYEKTAIVIDKFFEAKQQAMKWAEAHPMFLAVQIIPPANAKPETNEGSQW